MSNPWVSSNSIRSDLNELGYFYHPSNSIRLVGNGPPPPLADEYHDMESEEEEEEVFCGQSNEEGPNLNLITDMLKLVEEEESNTDALRRFVSKPPDASPSHVYIDIQKPTKISQKRSKNIIPVSIKRNTQDEKPQHSTIPTSMIPSFGFRNAISSIKQTIESEENECNSNINPSTALAACQPLTHRLSANVPEFVPTRENVRKTNLTPDAPVFVPAYFRNSQLRHVMPSDRNRDTNSDQQLDNHKISERLIQRNVLSVPDKKITKRKIVKDKPEDLRDVFNICNSELPYADKHTIDSPSNIQNKFVTNSNSIKQTVNNEAIDSILRMSRDPGDIEIKKTPSSTMVKLLTPNDFKISSKENVMTPKKSFDIMDEIRKLGLESRECKTTNSVELIEKKPGSEMKNELVESCLPTAATLQNSRQPAFTGEDKVIEWLSGSRREVVHPKKNTEEILKPFGFRKTVLSNNESLSPSTTFSRELEVSSSSTRTTPVPDYQPRASYYELHAKLLKSAEDKENAQVRQMDWWEKAQHLMKKKEEAQRNSKRASKTK